MQKILVAFSSAYNRRQKFSKHFKILVQVGFTTSKVQKNCIQVVRRVAERIKLGS